MGSHCPHYLGLLGAQGFEGVCGFLLSGIPPVRRSDEDGIHLELVTPQPPMELFFRKNQPKCYKAPHGFSFWI